MFEVIKAERKATPALIGLWGPSGSGKTLSALKIARGLVGDEGKIVLADTENRRAEFYANEVGGWFHMDIQPPFSPDRYTQAMRDAEAAGADVIIFDSMSHCWEGEGGVIEMAENNTTSAGRPMQGLAKWNAPKMAYKRMFNALLRSKVHVIFCLRAKEMNVQRGKGNNAEIVAMGLTPICEKNFIYEMTLAFLIGPDHKPLAKPTEHFHAAPHVPAYKVPQELLSSINPDDYLSETTGGAIAEWIGGGATFDHDLQGQQQAAREIAMQGSVAFRDWWAGRTKDQNKPLHSILEELKNLAIEADRSEAEAARDQSGGDYDDSDPLSDDFTQQEDAA